MLAILVDILQKVDAGLVLTPPLLLTVVPLFFVLLLSQLVDVALVGSFVSFLLVVMLLQLLNLPSAGKSFSILSILHGLFVGKSLVKKNLVAVALHLVCSLAKLLLSGVVGNQLKVALAVQKELLVGVLLFLLLFDNPLLFEHSLLFLDELSLLLSLDLTSLLLPVKHGHGILDLLLLLAGLGHLPLELFLGI